MKPLQMIYRKNSGKIFCLFTAIVFLTSCRPAVQGNSETPKEDTTKLQSFIRDSLAKTDSLELHFYFPENACVSLVSERPLRSDTSVVFACAAAFTLLENDGIDGLFIENGSIMSKHVNHSLGGGVLIYPDSMKKNPLIFGTEMGQILDSFFIDSVCAMKASFYQEIQMVREGEALVFRKDVSRFQRRALCVWNGRVAVVESSAPCTLQEFANALKNMGIRNAIYCDGGSWDEGWFRDETGVVHAIGLMRNQTARQSNWLIFHQ